MACANGGMACGSGGMACASGGMACVIGWMECVSGGMGCGSCGMGCGGCGMGCENGGMTCGNPRDSPPWDSAINYSNKLNVHEKCFITQIMWFIHPTKYRTQRPEHVVHPSTDQGSQVSGLLVIREISLMFFIVHIQSIP